MRLKGKKVLIMGLGLNDGGVGAAKFFSRRGANVVVTDLRTEKELAPSLKKLSGFRNIKYVLGRHRVRDFKNTDLIIKGPGVPNKSGFLKIAKKYGKKIDTDIGIFFELCLAPIIGVTGSKGKSTTSSLVRHILRKMKRRIFLAGNIGKSPLDLIGRISKDSIVVLELSSWQLEGLSVHKKSPNIAVITNILREHLNRYGSFSDYVRAKSLIFKYQKTGDYSIANQGVFKMIRPHTGTLKSKKAIIKPYVFPTKRLGIHQEDISAAVTVSRIFNVSNPVIRQGIRSFRGLPGRVEKIVSAGGIEYYNDTASTMPDSTIFAIDTLGSTRRKNLILIAGGEDKKLNFDKLFSKIMERVRILILLPGSATEKIKLKIRHSKLKVFNSESMPAAVLTARKNAEKGDIILLSPAAASFNLFKNEFDRGEQFVNAVHRLIKSVRR